MSELSDQGSEVTAAHPGRADARANVPAVAGGVPARVVDVPAVGRVRTATPPEADVIDAADVFGLLGDPGRLRLLMALLAAGELCVGDLAVVSQMSESAVSHALRLLRAHRMVAVTRRGRLAYYRLDDAHVRMLLEVGLTHTRHTDAVHPERAAARP